MKKQLKKTVGAAAAVVTVMAALVGCTPEGEASNSTGGVESMADVNVALVPGGAHPFFQPWKTGSEKAIEDFEIGKTTFNETGEWDQTKQNSAIDALAAQGYNAFGVFGVSATDVNTTYTSLKNENYAVGALGACPAGETNSADFCLSTDVATAAYTAAQAAIEAMGGSGNLVHLTGNATDTNTQRRVEGIKKAVDETAGAVKLLTTVTDIDKDLQTAQKAVSDLLATQGSEIQGIVTTAYNPAVAATQGVIDSGLPIKLIAVDDDPSVIKAIADGDITGTVVQNPYGQGYVGTWALAALATNQCTVKDPGFYLDSGSFLITEENAATYEDERLAKTDEILKKFQTELFDCK